MKRLNPSADFNKKIIGTILLLCLFIFFLNCSIKPTVDDEGVPTQVNANEKDPAYINQNELQSKFYLSKVQPIFNNRCVVCHACIEAPCSLYLQSYDGVRRGARSDSKLLSSVFSNQPVRLKDGSSLEDWKKKGFSKVANFDGSVDDFKNNFLFRYIEQAANQNVGAFDYRAAEKYLDNGKVCPSEAKMLGVHFEAHPYVGMPYALPALSTTQTEIIRKWAQEGSRGPSERAKIELETPFNPEPIVEWESFLNEGSLKTKLSARFIYEHIFTAHIHFERTPDNEFFEIIRSRTHYPNPPIEIVTERPFDDPKVETFYYRFKKVTQTIVRKTHVTLELDNKDLVRWKKSFIDAEWGDSNILPVGYESKNPFEYFKQIPAKARYSFMLDKSYTLVNAMIRGSVCTGKRATYAIRDHFWVLFLDPDSDPSVKEPEIGEREWLPLSTSKEDRDNLIKKLLKADSNKFSYSTDMIWKGNSDNPNALLTIFRHELSATVNRGLLGKLPDTIWVVNFSNLERIYYNLVVEFMSWGSAAHQYSTWRAMTYHRQEAEERFLMFFPPEQRTGIRNRWKEGLSEYANILLAMKSTKESPEQEEKNSYPVRSLMTKIISEMPKKVIENPNPYYLKTTNDYQPSDSIDSIEKWEQELKLVSTMSRHKFAQYLPNITYLKIDNEAYSILSNRAFKFNDMILGVNLAYDAQYDTISILKGLIGDRPELFIELSLSDSSLFLKRLLAVNSASDWMELKKRYAVRRNDSKIWTDLDWFHNYDKTTDQLESGVIDMNQYDITTF
jgi:hypothetical protein